MRSTSGFRGKDCFKCCVALFVSMPYFNKDKPTKLIMWFFVEHQKLSFFHPTIYQKRS
jgi:hypothetical protein